LVGGHCIGVDPYYLAHKAESLGYHPQVILSGRRVNDNMGVFIANKVVKLMIGNGLIIKGANVLILGFTFKENCPDIRNTKVIDVYNELLQFNLNVDIYDPWADNDEVFHEFGIRLIPSLNGKKYHSVVAAVAHYQFHEIDYTYLREKNSVIFDIKSFINSEIVDGRL
jgi:UDP-N-acetyl-D-galactosamine dehydrogenase